MKGRIREIAVKNLFTPLLPEGVMLGSGKIMDFTGLESAETDVILHYPAIMPAFMYEAGFGLYPIESCLHAIEVKSRATAPELKDALEKGRRLRSLAYTSGLHDPTGAAQSHSIINVIPAFFAFDSDLANGGKSELARYQELDDKALTDPAIRVLCIVGRGYWCVTADGKWHDFPATAEFQEVLTYLSGTVNSLPGIISSRGFPQIGNYLV